MMAKSSNHSNNSSTSDEYIIVLKNKDKMLNDSNTIELNVILSLAYQKQIFKILVPVSVIRENSNELFDINEMINNIFSKNDKIISSEYILSYYLNDENESYNDNIKKYKYLGEINEKNLKSQKLILDIPKDKIVYLKLRQIIKREKLFNPEFFENDKNTYTNSLFNCIKLNEDAEDEEKANEAVGGRGKEKNIEFAITTVYKWKKIREKSKNKISLEEAARMLGVKKKTLDSYELSIIKGKKNNFDFQKNYKWRINRLINFNKISEKGI